MITMTYNEFVVIQNPPKSKQKQQQQTHWSCLGYQDTNSFWKLVSKGKESSIYLVSSVWTIFQDNQRIEEKFFLAISTEGILALDYRHSGIPNETMDINDAQQWLLKPSGEKRLMENFIMKELGWQHLNLS